MRDWTLIQEGKLLRAARALVSMAWMWTQRRPYRRCRPRVPEDPQEIAPITINSEEVEEAIKSFRPGSAPSPSGLRGKHLKKAW